jgi:uroporphyrin-III C-methyltransferase
MHLNPELIIIGAGPGDPDLITVKAAKALQQAAVVLYDNLANVQLLEMTQPRCERIYVGKQPYGDYTPQDIIHELIAQKAFSKGNVVRLKGGDPFIFGRGFEEMLYARKAGIKASYIPGISALQTLGYEDIPLTHRNISDGFWVMTGTKADGTLTADLELAIQSKATVVIYMGMKKLSRIAAVYISSGQSDMPAAVIQHASLPVQKCIKATIGELPKLALQHDIKHPALIVIGKVVDVENSLQSGVGQETAVGSG